MVMMLILLILDEFLSCFCNYDLCKQAFRRCCASLKRTAATEGQVTMEFSLFLTVDNIV